MYEHILVATDGSEPSVAATRHAVDIAEKYGSTVHAVYVVDTKDGWLTISKDEVRDAIRDLGQETGMKAFDDVERISSKANTDLHTEILEGSPDEQILQYVEDHAIDLVVMGTHGRAGIEKRILGSITNRVVRSSPVPVMTVRAQSED